MSENQNTEQNKQVPDTPFDAAMERLKQIKGMIAAGVMIEGEDYGVIPGTTKPTLYKRGAQKLMAAFSLASIVREVVRESRIDELANGTKKEFVAYRVIVTLQSKLSGMTEAEGVGSCNSGERRYARQNAADIDNTVLKMARKRGLVDATGASSLFTQDIEDMDLGNGSNNGNPQYNQPQNGNSSNGNRHNGSTPAPPAAQAAPAQTEEVLIATEAQLRRANEIRIAAVDMGFLLKNGEAPPALPAGMAFETVQRWENTWLKFIEKCGQVEAEKRATNAAAKDLTNEEKANGEGFA